MKIEYINLKDVIKTKQEFALIDLMPIPKNAVSMLASRGGVGKSFISLQLACEWTKEHKKGNVACWYTEDEPEFVSSRLDDLIKCGIIAQDINKDRIKLITTPPPQLAKIENGKSIADYDCFADIRCWCVENDINFIILDPLLPFYGLDENNNSQARVFMQPFIEWAKNDNMTILIIHHANKSGDSTRGAGAFIDAVRCVYEMHTPKMIENKIEKIDKVKYEAGIRLLKNTKDNRGVRMFLPNIEYEIKALPPIPQKKNQVDIVYEMALI